MSLIARCQCGKSFQAKPELAGKRVKCPACGQVIQVPRPPATDSAGGAAAKIAVACRCGSRFQAQPQLAGKQVACPSCKQPLTIPARQTDCSDNEPVPADPLGDLGAYTDPFAGATTPAAGGALPAYGTSVPQRPVAAKAKSSGIPKAVLYAVGGIFGVIFLACAGFFITGFVFGVKQGIDNANGVWKPHMSRTGGYMVMLPGRVSTETRTAEFANFTAPAEDVYATAANGDVIEITVCYDMPEQKAGAKTWAEGYADAVAIDFGQVDRSEDTFAGRKAIQLRGVLKFEGQSSNQHRWIFMARNRFYDVAVSNAVTTPDTETVSKIRQSFRLMPGSVPLAASSNGVVNPLDRMKKAAAGEWSAFDGDSHFTIDLPPTVRNESLLAIAGRPDLVYYERTPRGKNYKFKVGYTRQLVQQPNESVEQVLERFAAMFRPENNEVLKISIESEKAFQHNQSSGREITFGWSLGSTRANSRLRLLVYERRVFWLECITVAGQTFPTSEFEKLCESFRAKSAT